MIRDQHFSVLNRALKRHQFKNQCRISSAKDVVDALNNSAAYITQEKLEDGKSILIQSPLLYCLIRLTLQILKNIKKKF